MKRALVFMSTLAATAAVSTSVWAAPRDVGQRAKAGIQVEQPAREIADKLFYGRLGQGMGIAGGMRGGPEVGLGLRLETGRIGLDASMSFGVTQMNRNMEITGMRGSWLKLTAQYLFMPQADATPYLGAGLSWGGQKQRILGDTYSGSGLQGEIVAGYEFLRSSTVRLFLQADATLPFYQAARGAVPERLPLRKAGIGAVEHRYLPTMGLSLGIAWGRGHHDVAH